MHLFHTNESWWITRVLVISILCGARNAFTFPFSFGRFERTHTHAQHANFYECEFEWERNLRRRHWAVGMLNVTGEYPIKNNWLQCHTHVRPSATFYCSIHRVCVCVGGQASERANVWEAKNYEHSITQCAKTKKQMNGRAKHKLINYFKFRIARYTNETKW